MQHRMKTYKLEEEQINTLLTKEKTCCLATVNDDGTPYTTPVHFVCEENCVYVHGLPKGQKIENIGKNPNVSMSVYAMGELILDPVGKVCDTNTEYWSVNIQGTASILKDIEGKKHIFNLFVEKYTPHLIGNSFPENMVVGTGVIKIAIKEITGKYYK